MARRRAEPVAVRPGRAGRGGPERYRIQMSPRVVLILILAVLFGSAGCGGARPPVTPFPSVEAGPAQVPATGSPDVPVVLVPGITGSALRVRATGEVVWGEGRDLVLPRDGGYNTVLPIAGPVRLEAFRVLDELRLGTGAQGDLRSAARLPGAARLPARSARAAQRPAHRARRRSGRHPLHLRLRLARERGAGGPRRWRPPSSGCARLEASYAPPGPVTEPWRST